MSNTEGAKGQCLSSLLAEPISNTHPSSEEDSTPQPSSPCQSSASDQNTSIDSYFELSICVSTRPGDKLNISTPTRPDDEAATDIDEEETPDIENKVQSHQTYAEIRVVGSVRRASSCGDISKGLVYRKELPRSTPEVNESILEAGASTTLPDSPLMSRVKKWLSGLP